MRYLKNLLAVLNSTLPHQKALRLSLGIILATTFVLWMEHYWQVWLTVTALLYVVVKLLEALVTLNDISPDPGPEPSQVAMLFALGAPAIVFRLLSGRRLFSNTL
jgi:hypothetical protein